MLETIHHDAIVELRLARPPVNALDPELVRTLRNAVESAPANGARGIMLSGRAGMFSAGLDVPALLQLDREEMIAFWHEFFGLCAALANSPIPVVAAIGGHSPAGGAVLAIFCDYRVMARSADPEKPFRIGLNEVQVGLSVPDCIQCALRPLIGFVDELADVGHVDAHALKWLQNLLKLPAQAMSTTRLLARADMFDIFSDPSKLSVEEFTEGWFGAESQATLKALVSKLKKAQ